MDSERLNRWAHLAEIVSGIAVVGTLIFLIFEIRENSDLIRANTFEHSIESLIDWRMQIVSNEQSLQTMADYWDSESPELLRRQLLVVNMWSIYEKTYYSQKYGLIGPAEWGRFERVICKYTKSTPDFWKENVAKFLTEDFRDFVISTCNLTE
jgi:hypothetical protein